MEFFSIGKFPTWKIPELNCNRDNRLDIKAKIVIIAKNLYFQKLNEPYFHMDYAK